MAAYTELTVLGADIDGDSIIALLTDGDGGGDSGFEFANDGRVLLYVIDELATGAGDTITFEGVTDKYGRDEADLTRAVTLKGMFVYGPFDPSLWNKGSGMVRFDLTTKNAKTKMLAVRVANPQ